ncbi:uncharacterized protein LOC131064145 isoform X1 [Cryptomeria japonica]|uniref:uncharacterized protein LOC131064145 isoform X1 n=1 Tax=Cryptomeria japonica TaxID=3369 RepID=UPI0027D9D27F|nr:uncharacterized protein LOC131064145 isoform X1 [Cryptomeria japonica]XP_057854154.2 uncharacterized protein LOC131064145 isoform X1 [Cryptomeria japonica]
MTGASGKDMSAFDFDFNDCPVNWGRNGSFRDKNPRNPNKTVTKDDFMRCFSRKSSIHLMETNDELNSEYVCYQQGEITESNADDHTESLADYRGLDEDAPVNNDEGKQMTSSTHDHSGEEQVDLISEDEGHSERRFCTSNAMSEASDDEGASEHSYEDTSHNSDEYENTGSEDMEIYINPEFGLFGDVTFLAPRLIFSAEGIKLEIVDHKSSLDEVNAFQWNIFDVEYLKTYWLSGVNVAVAILDLKKGCNNELETFFRVTGTSVLFAFNDASWLEQFQHIVSLNDAYGAIWKSLDGSIFRNEDIIFELLPRNLSFAIEDQDFGRFEETFCEFVFPKGDPDAVAISGRDIVLLQPETFINDTLIDFYIKYLQSTISYEKRDACHFFNSFFFRKLADLDKAPDTEVVNRQAFQRVRKWTRRVNLFEKDYIFIPVNYSLHWSLIVICNPGAVLEDENHSKTPCILHMDSLGSHTSLRKLIQSYLWEEWRERHMEDEAMFNTAHERFSNMTFISVEAPQQDNCFDCGLFLLHYVEMFLRDAPAKFNLLELKRKVSKFLSRDWFLPAEASLLKRFYIRKLIHQLSKQYSGIGSIPGYGANHQLYEQGQRDTGTSQEVECVLEECVPNQACTESLLFGKVNELSLGHTDADAQTLLCRAGKTTTADSFEKDFGLVCAEYGGIETDNHIGNEEQFGSFHCDILSQQLKSTQDMPPESGTNQLSSDLLYQFVTSDHGQSDKETAYFSVPPAVPSGIQRGLMNNQHSPNTNQLVDNNKEHPGSSSKGFLCKEGSEFTSLPTASESPSHIGICTESNYDTRPRKKLKALDDTVMHSEEIEKSTTIMPDEELEKCANEMDLKNAEEMSISVEPRLDSYSLLLENMMARDSGNNASHKDIVLSLEKEKPGNTKLLSSDNDKSTLWKQISKSLSEENFDLQNLADVSNCETVARSCEDPGKSINISSVPVQADRQSPDHDYDADFTSLDKCKPSSSMEDCARSAGNMPENSVMVVNDQKCDDSVSKPIENLNKLADSNEITENVDKSIILEDKTENEDVHTVVDDYKCTNSVSSTNEINVKYVGTEGRLESPPESMHSPIMTPQNKQKFPLEGSAECLSSDFSSPPPESIISRTRSQRTPSTVAKGRNLNGVKGSPQVLERPRTRSVTKNMNSSNSVRENRRRKLSNSNY